MEESATYQAIVRRGRAEGERHLLLLQGERKFGPADAAVRAALENINDLARLEELAGSSPGTTGVTREIFPLTESTAREALGKIFAADTVAVWGEV